MPKKIVSLILIASLVLFASITAAFAWFTTSHVFNPDVSGGSLTGYFVPGGEGTKEKPYEIDSWVHVYNLAWLQYMGELNKESLDEEGNPKISQIYFSLIDDIDMEGIILPPIGTAEHPFVGHFDGNGHCISNLTVSNYLDGGENEFGIEKRPLSVTNIDGIDGTTVSVIGFFGIVGAIDDDMKSKLIDDSTSEGEDIVISEKVNAVHDLFLDNLTIRTETDESLIGLFAGYVNASVSNVGIGESSLCVGDNVQPLSAMEMEYVISSYSLIGKHNEENVSWKDVITDAGGNGGGSEGWGGSINMRQLRQRITYIVGAVGLTSFKIDKYGFNSYFGANQADVIDGTLISPPTTTVSILDGTVMPISIDQSIFDEGEVTVTQGVLSLKTLPYYQDNIAKNVEAVVTGNSGYIIGGGTRTWRENGAYINFGNAHVSGHFYAKNSYGVGIAKSIGTSLASGLAFPENNLHMLTVGIDGNTYVISDGYNANANTWIGNNYSSDQFKSYSELGLKKYQIGSGDGDIGVRTAFVNGYSGESMLQGIQFTSKIDLSSLEKATVDNITLLGSTYNGYEMVKGAINFSLKEAGIATTIAATYSQYLASIDADDSGKAHSLFRIFEIKRDTSNKIVSCTQINTIHERRNGSSVEYVYNLGSDYNETGYTLVFDFDKMSTLSEVGAAYYFEIPLNAGDYAIGSPTADSSKIGAYLLYLDIGANGDTSSNDTSTTQKPTHYIEGVTFVGDDAIAAKSIEEYSVVFFSVEIKNNVTEHDGLQITFDRKSKTEMDYAVTDADNAFTVTPKKRRR